MPMLRLQLGAIGGGGRKAGPGGGERAVANFDEDCVTMAVAAAMNCLDGIDRASVDGVLFASTSYPYKEKQAASVIAKALDLRRDVATADLTDSLRAGTSALRAAIDSVKAGSARTVLVIASDCRVAAPRSALEKSFGDGAGAFLIGTGDVAATVEHHHVISDEIIDVWRTESDRFVKSWEDRFVVEHGYTTNMVDAINGLLQKSGLAAKDFSKAVLYSPDARSCAGVARATGFEAKTQVQDLLFGKLGNTGAAFAPMLLVAALEQSKPGSRLLLANYGDGAEALAINVTEHVARLWTKRGMKWHMERRAELSDYDTYLNFRNLQTSDVDRRGGQGMSATVHFRDRDEDISFRGHKCRRCGTMQFPFQRVCFQCFAKDDFEQVRLSDKHGKLLSFTFDFFAGSPNPPLIVTMTEVDGGARVYLQMTDASPKEVKLELPVEFAFRKIHEYGGTPNYFWKCTPLRS
ncbi:MAG: 3-hydroxy-3-methylglutaryl CoA synthase [Deltaproteobacteria bacterium]|nr:3-hydroxy-3-methylglutaryl CoA synthase [Deltaproteobacteria bacterium]MBI3388118.1 3-hydroxy-3-methylglutaryl CoA synthase [Deltaproteobacteria bacterium]